LLVRTFGREEVRKVEDRRHTDRRFSTSKLLPEILELKGQGLTRRQIGERLGLTKRQVEHVLRRHREQQRLTA
jgi:DNA-binding transcriptional regulator LsrR (DeoR family)